MGATMIRSPGAAASIAAWIELVAATGGGALPPIVTVTVSTDVLPLPAVMISSPQLAVEPPYCTCCCMAQLDCAAVRPGAVTVIEVSDHPVIVAATPPIVTLDTAGRGPPMGGHWVPKPCG